jgi:hypothetical protein
MALFSKMGAVACIPVLALHRIFYRDLDRSRSHDQPLELRPTLNTLVPLAPHAALTSGIVLWYGRLVGEYGVTGWRGLGPTDPEHIINVLRFAPLILGRYVQQIFWPSEPSMFYRWPHVEIPLNTFELAGSALIAALGLAAILYCCARRRDLAFYLLSFIAFLIPYLNIVYVDIWSADRYVYLSSFCLLAIVVSGMMQLRDRSAEPVRRAIIALFIGFGLSSAIYSLQHQGVWSNAESLWRYEAYRDEPSLLSIRALAKLHMRRAEAETDAMHRAELIVESRREIRRGFEREKALGRVSAPYATSEQLQLSQLHYLLGRLDMIEQASLESQIEHFTASHTLAPSRSNTLMLAGTYFDLAMTTPDIDQEKLLRRSLDYFLEYVAFSKSDQYKHQQNLALLDQNYGQHFPSLRTHVDDVTKAIPQ